jgi:hypothetical protein
VVQWLLHEHELMQWLHRHNMRCILYSGSFGRVAAVMCRLCSGYGCGVMSAVKVDSMVAET